MAMRTLANQPFLHVICKQSASSVALKPHRRDIEFCKDVDYPFLYVIRLPVVAYPTVNVILITVFIDYRHSAVVAALFFRIANGKDGVGFALRERVVAAKFVGSVQLPLSLYRFAHVQRSETRIVHARFQILVHLRGET